MFFASSDGTLHDTFVNSAGNWDDYSIPSTSPTGGSAISTVVEPGFGRNAFYESRDGTLHDAFVQNAAWTDYAIPGAAMAPNSAISAVEDPATGVNVFFEGPGGTLQDAFVQNDAWTDYTIPNAKLASGSAISVLDDPSTGRSVFVEGTDGGLYDIFVQNGAWTTYWLPNTHLAPHSSISSLDDPTTGRNVFVQGADDNMYDVFVQNGAWTLYCLTTTPMAPASAISAVDDPVTGRNVFFEGPRGTLHDAWVNGGAWTDTTVPGRLTSSSSINAVEDGPFRRNVFVEGPSGLFDVWVDTTKNNQWSDVFLTSSIGSASPIDGLWATDAAGSPDDLGTTLSAGQTMYGGQYLSTPDGEYAATMQVDGNLVLSGPSGAYWSSGTQGNPRAYAVMQTDGNLNIYATSGAVVWTTTTFPYTEDSLSIDDDGNLNIVASDGLTAWIGVPTKTGAFTALVDCTGIVKDGFCRPTPPPSGTVAPTKSEVWDALLRLCDHFQMPHPSEDSSFESVPTSNENGVVLREAGTTGNQDTVRMMFPGANVDYPEGYVVYYNDEGGGQPINPETGKAGNDPDLTHIRPGKGGPWKGLPRWWYGQ